MHIVVATANLPWPATDGGKISQFRTLESLEKDCRFTIIVPVHGDSQLEEARRFEKALRNVTVIPIQSSTPRTGFKRVALSAGRRLYRIAGSVKSAITSVKAESRNVPTQSHPIEEVPYYPFSCLSPIFVNTVVNEISKGCDIFQAELLEMASLGLVVPKSVPKIFIHQQIHHVYCDRIKSLSKSPSAYLQYLVSRMRYEEQLFLEPFDGVVTFSKVDLDFIKPLLPKSQLWVSPFPCPEEPLSAPPNCSTPPSHLVLVASEFGPNLIGFRWFMSEVWPLVRRIIPDLKVQVIGRWSSEAQKSVPNSAHVEFLGFVPELGPALKDKVMIVPLQVGSGIRTKILAAWALGCPVVTTSVGVEGLPGEDRKEFLLADDPNAFCSACVELMSTASTRGLIVKNGLERIFADYTLSAVRQKRLSIYKSLVNR
jgi:glycosyltransferase involved in cell wall biosynthesis